MEDYADCQCIDSSQFNDIFSPIVDDPDPFFLLLQNEKNLDGVVDVYEAFAVFAAFCKDPFERKVQFIFELFDFDHSKTLQLPELILTMQSVLRGLCKFVHITPPPLKSIEEDAALIFSIVDRDHNEKISISEFILWIKHCKELQSFILKYAGIQTYENLSQVFQGIYSDYQYFFAAASKGNIENHAEASVLRQQIEKREKGLIKESDIDFLMDVLKYTNLSVNKGRIAENLVPMEVYEAVIRAWCCYLTSDLNHDNQLVSPELHALLWLYEEKEPSDDRMRFELGEMAKNPGGGLTMNSWLKGLCVMESDGKYSIRPRLRKMFEKYDKDGSGYLTVVELKEVLSETFNGYVVRSGDESVKKNLDGMIDSLTQEIVKELDYDGSRNVGWEEFKTFMDVSYKKIDKLRNFLDMNLK